MPEGYTTEEAKSAIEALGKTAHDLKAALKERDEEIKKLGEAKATTEEKLARIEEAVNNAEDQKGRLDRIETAIKRVGTSASQEKGQSEEMIAYKKGLEGYMRKGIEDGLEELQQKALAVQSDPDGGFWVTPDMSGQMVRRVFETSPLRSIAAVQSISTGILEGLVDDDEAGAEWVGETDSPTNTDTPRIGKWRIPVHEQATRPKATAQFLEDSQVNVESWLMDKVMSKFARTENAAFVDGNGSAKPRGFLDYATGDAETYARGTVGAITSGTNDAIDFDDIIDLYTALKAEYRANSTFVFNRRTLGYIRKLADSQGQYLWQPSQQVGEPSSIYGRPYVELEDMPDVADGTTPIVLADWQRFYQIVDRIGLAVLRDPYSAKPYVEFYVRRRVGGDVIDFDAGKALVVQ